MLPIKTMTDEELLVAAKAIEAEIKVRVTEMSEDDRYDSLIGKAPWLAEAWNAASSVVLKLKRWFNRERGA